MKNRQGLGKEYTSNLKNRRHEQKVYLGDTALHDEKRWVVHVQLHGAEQVLDVLRFCALSIDLVFIAAPDLNL